MKSNDSRSYIDDEGYQVHILEEITRIKAYVIKVNIKRPRITKKAKPVYNSNNGKQ